MTENHAQLQPEWQAWIKANLQQGADVGEIIGALENHGLSTHQASAAVDNVAGQTNTADGQNKGVIAVTRLLAQCQQLSAADVPRYTDMSADFFHQHFYSKNQPVIWENFAGVWPAMKNWSPEFFRKRFGESMVDVCVDRVGDQHCDEKFQVHQRAMTMKSFVDLVAAEEGNNNYMIANNRVMERTPFLSLLDDVDLPDDIFDSTKKSGYTSLWIGPKNTVTSLHHDQNNIMFTQIYGQKRFKLISPVQTDMFLAARNFYSDLDPEQPDLTKFPWWDQIKVLQLDLNPGDALFIPVGWWHHVRSLNTSISISFLNFHAENDYSWYAPASP